MVSSLLRHHHHHLRCRCCRCPILFNLLLHVQCVFFAALFCADLSAFVFIMLSMSVCWMCSSAKNRQRSNHVDCCQSWRSANFLWCLSKRLYIVFGFLMMFISFLFASFDCMLNHFTDQILNAGAEDSVFFFCYCRCCCRRRFHQIELHKYFHIFAFRCAFYGRICFFFIIISSQNSWKSNETIFILPVCAHQMKIQFKYSINEIDFFFDFVWLQFFLWYTRMSWIWAISNEFRM